MKSERVDPFEGLLKFVATLSLENPYPDWQITDKLEGITIDSSLPKDTMLHETGIKREAIEGIWIIVEQYPDETGAKEGHLKWTELMRDYPDYPLKDIDSWSLEEK
ncbi:hypothetical protein LCGC14_2143210 [marine sediment metagenome]|uniref:Uncharacterized protein n=1 Tax=marine sediment metagenome TaxID=412755 RepID=A0A0F9EK06_9ZZZZ